jgi:hypothetical protein
MKRKLIIQVYSDLHLELTNIVPKLKPLVINFINDYP